MSYSICYTLSNQPFPQITNKFLERIHTQMFENSGESKLSRKIVQTNDNEDDHYSVSLFILLFYFLCNFTWRCSNSNFQNNKNPQLSISFDREPQNSVYKPWCRAYAHLLIFFIFSFLQHQSRKLVVEIKFYQKRDIYYPNTKKILFYKPIDGETLKIKRLS